MITWTALLLHCHDLKLKRLKNEYSYYSLMYRRGWSCHMCVEGLVQESLRSDPVDVLHEWTGTLWHSARCWQSHCQRYAGAAYGRCEVLDALTV